LTAQDCFNRTWRRLAAAILLQAIQDANLAHGWSALRGPGCPEEARAWLRSPDAQRIAAVLELDNTLAEWLNAFPLPGKERPPKNASQAELNACSFTRQEKKPKNASKHSLFAHRKP
jgi:hypothetical protein